MDDYIKCRICGEMTHRADMRYSNSTRVPDRCGDCWNRYNREYRAKNKEKFKEYRAKRKDIMIEYRFNTRYNITTKEYNKLVELHQGGCAICRQPCKSQEKLSVDHDHKTGKVRGLLCSTCNLALGLLKEDENLLWNMLDYIKNNIDPLRQEDSYETITVNE